MAEDALSEIETINQIMSMLAKIDDDGRERVLKTITTYFRSSQQGEAPETPLQGPSTSATPYSEPVDLAPKEFLRQKAPQTDVERIACLAYYLTHYRDMGSFKTVDLSKLNTEAAQPKFSNAAKASGNALQYGYLAQSVKGHRQISAVGEEYVNALPDREAAKAAIERRRPRKRNRKRTAGAGVQTS